MWNPELERLDIKVARLQQSSAIEMGEVVACVGRQSPGTEPLHPPRDAQFVNGLMGLQSPWGICVMPAASAVS
ncbi:MAG: hypothetical protein M3072_14220 [Candidatus Dormibacteraeota bacterium]|nr:hypothetical protein [Candidatus Dormibacteraeota bacterium]